MNLENPAPFHAPVLLSVHGFGAMDTCLLEPGVTQFSLPGCHRWTHDVKLMSAQELEGTFVLTKKILNNFLR